MVSGEITEINHFINNGYDFLVKKLIFYSNSVSFSQLSKEYKAIFWNEFIYIH